jgi:hypothetical protein
MEKPEKIYHGRLEEAAIEELKKKHGEVFEIVVPMDDEEKEYAVGYVKKPTRHVLGAVSGMVNSNPVRAAEIMLANCWIAGDDRLKTDDDLFMSAIQPLFSIIKVRNGELKKK